MNYIPNWFHFYDTTESFEVHRKQGLINPNSICFLNQTGQIYTQKAFFGICRERYEKLEQLVLAHDAQIKNILGVEGPSVGDGIVNNIADLVNFLDGFTDQDNLKDFIDAMKNALETQITEVNRVLSERITHLEDEIRNDSEALHTAIDGINSKIDTINVRLDTHNTSISTLNTALAAHIREYNLLKTNYKNFKSYATTKFNAIDSSISSLTTSLNTLQQYFTELDEKFDDIENEVSEVKALLEDAKKLVQEVEDRFGETLAALEQFKRGINEEMDDFKALVGAPDGIAPLDGDAKVPSAYLPSYVDDVLEYATKGAFPVTGETGKIYVSLDDNLTYRWSGSTYIEISKSLGLGETATTAYPGNKGKKNADDIAAHKADYNNPHKVTKAQLGLDKVNNTSDEDKPISTAQQAALDVLTNSLEGHINDKTNPHDVTKAQVGLGNVDNTSDLEKPISTATQNVLDTKVDKIVGKGLSTNDFTNEDKAKLDRAITLNEEGKLTASQIPVDEEDLTVSGEVIKFKDRDTSNGMGYKILRLSEETDNLLLQEMINEPNTIYEIRYDFDLGGATINIPENCVLKFEGGSLNNGVIGGVVFVDGDSKGTAGYKKMPITVPTINFAGNYTMYDTLRGTMKEKPLAIEDGAVAYNIGRYSHIENVKINNSNKLHGSGIGTSLSISDDTNPMRIVLSNLEVSNFNKGVDLYKANYAILSNLHIYYNTYGIYIDAPNWAGSIVIEGCHIAYNEYGVYINAPEASSIWINNCTFEGNLHDIVFNGDVKVTNCYFGDQSGYDKTKALEVFTLHPGSNVNFDRCTLGCAAGDNRETTATLFKLLGTDSNNCKVKVSNSSIILGSQNSSDCCLYTTESESNIIEFNDAIISLSTVNKQHSWNYPYNRTGKVAKIVENNSSCNYIVNGYFDDSYYNKELDSSATVTVLEDKNMYGGNCISIQKYGTYLNYHIPQKYVGKPMALEIACNSHTGADSPRVYLNNSDLEADVQNLPVETIARKSAINVYKVIPTKELGRINIFVNEINPTTPINFVVAFAKLVPLEYRNKLDKFTAVNDVVSEMNSWRVIR